MKVTLLTAALAACGSPPNRTVDAGPDDAAGKQDACTGLQCRQVDCASMNLPPTTVSGTVYAPNETLPLYGVNVYVPNLAPGPFLDGVKCDRCNPNLPGEPVTAVVSDETGHFVLQNVPVGTDIPLVVTTGKWRRTVTIPNVVQCTDNPLPSNLTRLPRSKSEGDMPKIAMVTGGCDGLECLVKKLGVANSEFTNDAGPGRVHLFSGTGGNTNINGDASKPLSPRSTLMAGDKLKDYDLAFFSCECSEYANEKPQPDMDAIKEYANLGGRVFLSHYNHVWLHGDGTTTHQNDWEPLATCDLEGTSPDTINIDQMDNPKGMSFAKWMMSVGASSGQTIQLETGTGRESCSTIAADAERWAYATYPVMFQFYTPTTVPAADRCGKVVFSDMHVSETDTSNFPSGGGCGTELTPQEKALAFMFFDIASCVEIIN